MTYRMSEGFDAIAHEDAMARHFAAFSSGNGGGSSDFVDGRFNAGVAVKGGVGTPTSFITKAQSNVDEHVVGGAFKLYKATDGTKLVTFYVDGDTEQLSIVFKQVAGSTWRLEAVRGATTLATSTTRPGSKTGWIHIEVKATIKTTGGAVEVRINETTVLNVSGVNTADDAQDGCDAIGWSLQTDSGTDVCVVDDVFWLDTAGSANNDFIGDHQVISSLPVADGALSEWDTTSNTTHAAAVDDPEQADDDDSYNSTGTNDERDLYEFEDLPANVGAIHAVELVNESRLDTAGTKTVKGVARIGSTNYVATGNAVTDTVYQAFSDVYENNPATAAAWTSSDFNAAQFGVQSAA